MTIDIAGVAASFSILWNPSSVILENLFSTKWTISVNYRLTGSNKLGYLTNVYGLATQGDKLKFIQNLEWLATLTKDHRWILAGDFNMICNLDEKRGGIRRLEVESRLFQALIDKSCLIDLETQNNHFTWKK